MTPSLYNDVKTKRPLGVTVVAGLQFSKAGFLLLVAGAGLVDPNAQIASNLLVLALVYIAAHGTNPPAILLPVVAVFPAAIGWGLWHLQKWARWVQLVSSGVMAYRWVTALFLDWVLGETTLHTALARKTVWTLLLLDAMIFLYLIQSEVKSAFSGAGD